MKHFLSILVCIIAVLLTGCESKTTISSASSSVAKLTAFAFASNDTMPGLAAAVFTVDERLDTGLVWNKDSMLYGTRLDKVRPRFTFAATPSSAFLTFPDTTVVLTGYDTLDFTKSPVYLTIRSADKSTTKVYEIRPTVHQVDPDLYTWTQLTSSVYAPDDSEQRVVELGSDFVMMVSNGFELSAYRSADGVEWSDRIAPTGLPAGTHVRQIISDGTTLYYGQGNTVYTSTDAAVWTAHTVSATVVTMLLYWNKQVWVLTGVTFHSASLRDRAMIIGGFAENGLPLNTRWNLEYSPHTPEDNGYRLQEFSIDRPSFKSLTGVSVISYNGQLLLFGGVDDKMTYYGRDILISNDEGLNWYAADTAKNQLPEVYQARQKQTAIVRNNDIYLFGGQDAQTTFSDVYKGRLNSIDW